MKKLIALLLAALMALSMLPTAFAAEYKDKATVKEVQQALNDAGYDCGKPDGAAGKKTKAAITAYQTDKGLEVTGVIDDALLESLGIAMDAPEAAEAGDAGTAEGSEEAQIDWDNPSYVAYVYNFFLVWAFDALGVDVQNDDIVGAYAITTAEPAAGVKAGWHLLNPDRTVDLSWGTSEAPEMHFNLTLTNAAEYDAEKVQMTLSETAATASVLKVMSAYFGGKDEIDAQANAMLDAAPDRDGTASISIENYSVSGNGFKLRSHASDDGITISLRTAGEVTENDSESQSDGKSQADSANAQLPQELVDLTGGFPESLEALGEKYDLEALKTDNRTNVLVDNAETENYTNVSAYLMYSDDEYGNDFRIQIEATPRDADGSEYWAYIYDLKREGEIDRVYYDIDGNSIVF